MARTHAIFWAGLAGLLLASSAGAAELKTGNPKLQSIESVNFGPDGLLIIGDGKGAQVVAVQTGDTKPIEWGKIEGGDIKDHIGARLGTTGKGIEIKRLIVNPASRRAYVAVRKLDGKQDLIVTLDGQGKVQEFSLDNVKYNVYPLPTDPTVKTVVITDITYADGRILLAAQAKEKFNSKIYSIDTRDDSATPHWISTDTFHVAHNKWETDAPIRTVIPYTENGKKYLVGAFTCTPIVKYSLDDLKASTRVKGTSVIELGHGNTPLDMFVYEKGGKTYILMNNLRGFPKGGLIGPSPYWTAKVSHGILSEGEKINKEAVWRFKGNDPNENSSPYAQIIPEFAGVVMMDKLDNDRALVIRTQDKTSYNLAVVPLP